MNIYQLAGWATGMVVGLGGIALFTGLRDGWIKRPRWRRPETGSGDGSLVGIVHSMESGGPVISAGQSVFQKGTRVRDRKGGPKKLVYAGSVLHYDASPGDESAVVRWDSGIVTVERADDLEVMAS